MGTSRTVWAGGGRSTRDAIALDWTFEDRPDRFARGAIEDEGVALLGDLHECLHRSAVDLNVDQDRCSRRVWLCRLDTDRTG